MHPRRLSTALPILAACLLAATIAAPAGAGTVTLSDLAAAEDELSQAKAELTGVDGALSEAHAEEQRLTEARARIEDQGTAVDIAATDQDAEVRDRLVRMYVLAGSSRQRLLIADLAGFAARVAYLGAIADRDRDLLTRLDFSAADLDSLLTATDERLERQAALIESLEGDREEQAALVAAAEDSLSSLRTEWERQEAARRAAQEALLRQQEEELAAALPAATTTTAPASSGAGGGTTTTTAPASSTTSYDYDPTRGVEQWRPLVREVFARWGLDQEKCATRNGETFCVGSQVENALKVMNCESKGIPYAVNNRSGTSGLFQNHPDYWRGRVARIRSLGFEPDMPADASILNPEYNIAGAALLVWESRETILGNRGGGGVWPVAWPAFNYDTYEAYGYGYSNWGEGPEPWGHWVSCGAVTSAYPQGQGLYDPAWVHPWGE